MTGKYVDELEPPADRWEFEAWEWDDDDEEDAFLTINDERQIGLPL